MWLNPYEPYRYSLKRGMTGTDVAALQINFPDLVPDGWFGNQTHNRVVRFQERHGISPAEGIVGPLTNQKIVMVRSKRAIEGYGLPKGFLESIVAHESNFVICASSKHPSDSGIDVGAYMISSGSGPGTQNFYSYAYNIEKVSVDIAAARRSWYDKTPTNIKPSLYFNDLANGDVNKFRWEMAVLSHNWPDAAEDIPRYGYIYETDPARDDKPAEWIQTASGGRLDTPREWVYDYIQKSTIYWR